MGLMKNIGWDVHGCDPANESKNAKRKFGKKLKQFFIELVFIKKSSI